MRWLPLKAWLVVGLALLVPWDSGLAAGGYDLYLSSSPSRSGQVLLEGQTVSGPISVFTKPDSGVLRVRFFLDDPAQSGPPRKVEGWAPYDFAGTSADGTALPFDSSSLADGSHTITAAIDLSAGGTQVVTATFTKGAAGPPPPTALALKVNFQSEAAPVPTSYLRDFGEPFGPRSGADQGSGLSYGWVAPGTGTPLSLVGNGRDRNANGDQRLDTFLHMQANTIPGSFNGVKQAGSWEIAVPDGSYTVTVSVGDASTPTDSVHRILAEGQVLIAGFAPTASSKFARATRMVTVSDGRLTLGASGGTNTKLDYVTVTAPTAPFLELGWSTVAPSPIPRGEALGAVIGGRLYLFGGYFSGVSQRVDVYDPTSNSWTRIGDMPKAFTHAGTAIDGDDVYFAGGYVSTGGTSQLYATKEVWKFNATTGAWSNLPELPEARGSGALARLGRELHFFGGADGGRIDKGEHWVLSLDGGTSWTPSAPLPVPRTHMGAAVVGGKIYAIGGQQNVDAQLVTYSWVHVWDPANPGSWTAVEPLPSARSHIAAATFVLGGRIFVLGGETANGKAIADAIAYDPSSDSWQTLTPIPAARYSGVAGAIDGSLYFTTGSSLATTFKGVPLG